MLAAVLVVTDLYQVGLAAAEAPLLMDKVVLELQTRAGAVLHLHLTHLPLQGQADQAS
jgi:DNA-binding protein Fis